MTPKATQTHATVPPKVTVILPTYNRAAYLKQAIDSIRQQTLTDWELIIVDDASRDSTPDVVRAWTQKDPRIRYYRHQHNSGLATARNTGLKHARGTYIACQDDDDVSHPERLHRQADYLDKNPHIALLYVRLVIFSGDKAPPVSLYAQARDPRENYVSLMMPRIIYQKVLFRPFFILVEDMDFTHRVFEYCRDKHKMTDVVARLEDTLYAWRHHKHDTKLSHHRLFPFYHLLCLISRAHRRRGLKDPIDDARTIDDALDNIDPRFPRYLPHHHGIEKGMTEFILQYTNLPATASPDEQQCAAYARRLLALFARQLFRKNTVYRATLLSRLREAIRNNQPDSYHAILRLIMRYHPMPSLLFFRLAPRILFACLKRERVRFIVAYLRALMKMTP